MNTRCHPEQIAAVYWPGCAVHNHIVTVKTLIPTGTRFKFSGKDYHNTAGPAWWVECSSPVMTKLGAVSRFPVYDMDLRPIDEPRNGGTEQTIFQKPVGLTRIEDVQRQIAAANEARKYHRSQS